MSKLFTKVLIGACMLISFSAFAGNLWNPIPTTQAPANLQVMHPSSFLVYTVNEALLKLQMFNLSNDPAGGIVITLPLPNGTSEDFKVWQTPMMPDVLAAHYPEIKTFTATAVNDPRITAKLDFTVYGFHAMIFDGDNTSFIDPFDRYNDGFYMVHYKKDEVKAFSDRMKCLVKGRDEDGPAGESMGVATKGLPKLEARNISNAYQHRTYRLALACDHQYAIAATGVATPTVAQAFSCMTTSMNRINGVYEREFSETMNFVTKEDSLIFTTAAGDPYSADNDNPNNLLDDNQRVCDSIIGDANYDIGHVFTTGGGGLSSLGCICASGQKAASETGGSSPVGDGFDIDYVAHEMGHEHGANHTFNNNIDGSCATNAVSDRAYEPGSGTTIMAYAGICYPDDLAYHSQAYFHGISLYEIITYITSSGDVCAVKVPAGNKFTALPTFNASYTIPYKTPFELTAPTAVDSVADTAILYCWEQFNLGDFGKELRQTFKAGPIFRSYQPVYTPTRIFPRLSLVLSGTLSDVGVEGAQGEKAPDTARFLTFKLTVRNIINGLGAINLTADTLHLDVVSTGAAGNYQGFKVTSQNTTGISYVGGSAQSVTWNVVGTNTAPVSAASVNIYMSEDGGNTWASLGTFPNNGSAMVTISNPTSNKIACRFKVKGADNVFFNINASDFTVTYDSTLPQATTLADDVKIYPVPATGTLYISALNSGFLHSAIYNAIGQCIWRGSVDGSLSIPVALWAKGIYYIKLINKSNQHIVKKFVVE